MSHSTRPMVSFTVGAQNFNVPVYASDAAFVSGKGSSAAQGDIYFRTDALAGFREYVGGVWTTILYSSASLPATNSRLQIDSAGLITYSPISVNVTAKTATYAILSTDYFLEFDSSGGTFTATLPSAVTVGNGKEYVLAKTDTSYVAVTIATTSSQTFDGGGTSTTLNTLNETLTVVSDGANWRIQNRRIPSLVTTFTPTGSWSTNTTYTGFAKRIGDSMHYRIKIALAGAPTSATLTGVTGVTGLTWDTAKMPVLSSDSGFGQCYIFRGADKAMGQLMWTGSGSTVDAMYDVGDGTAARVSQSAPGTFANGDFLILEYMVPITGWNG